ncbi:GNAT family protein [Micromonospora coxensis]|uniref:GNAT family N-acetyltransferase n=1 Tax=Micromonospora coxensis TaxID=356852 RepID=UPI003417F8D1
MIETERLLLEILDVKAARAIASGDRNGRAWHAEFPRQDDRDAASMVSPDTDLTFGSRLIVEKESGLAVGTIGFFGPPDDAGTVMVGYGLVPSARGRGLATEALRAVVAHGFAQPSVQTMTADPLLDNVASHRVLEKAGFRRTHSTSEAHWYAIQRPGRIGPPGVPSGTMA